MHQSLINMHFALSNSFARRTCWRLRQGRKFVPKNLLEKYYRQGSMFFFWTQMKKIPYCGLLQKSKLTTIWNCFQRNPNWPQLLWNCSQKQFHIVDYLRNHRFWRFRKISILSILKFLRIYQQYQKSLWPISQKCRLRHFPEVSTQNSSRCSIHGRTHGRTDGRNSVRK